MQWLNKIVDEVMTRQPEGEILVESGSSPSGTYHMGHLRELITCDSIVIELRNRGRQAKHVAYVDDLDGLRKIPVNVSDDYQKYLGRSLCDIPAPDGSDRSYAEQFTQGLIDACAALKIDVEFIYSHTKYREGFFVPAIELALDNVEQIRQVLETISGHKLGDDWSPIQINEDSYLKKRRFVSLDKTNKIITYEDKDGNSKTIGYGAGQAKLDWRIDWPARWWRLGIGVEPFGRDHATKGGSYDTGAALSEKVFNDKAPLPVPYDFVNLAGDTKKMSASKGTGLDAVGVVKTLPPEIVRFFMLRYPPAKRLYFDPINGVAQLIDEFSELLAKPDKTKDEEQLLAICTNNLDTTISKVPFSHLVASYQAVLRNPDKTIELLKRESEIDDSEQTLIKQELNFIGEWLDNWAPEDIKFSLKESINPDDFSDEQKGYLNRLADEIAAAPADADGEWFHKAIYEIKESMGLTPQVVFKPIYRALIGKDQGPRAGWFLSILDRDWLIKRLRLEA